MNTGKIYKAKQEANFTIIPNAALEDKALSLKAIGLLCYILKFPPDWALNKTHLHKTLNGGRDLIDNAFKELEAAGYIVKQQVRGKSGAFIGYNYEVFQSPQRENGKPVYGQPETEKPEPVKPASGKSDTINKDSTNKKSTKKDKAPPSGEGDAVPLELTGNTPKKEKKAPGPKIETNTMYPDFIDIYDKWFKKFSEGIPPDYKQGNANAAKMLMEHFRRMARARAKMDKIKLDEKGVDIKALEGWAIVLNNWHKLDNFLQGKTRLVDINSNIQNIIIQIKKGHGKTNSGKQPTGGDVTNSSLAQSVAAMYADTGK